MTGKPGRWLTHQESVRLSAVDAVGRDKFIRLIVEVLRAKAKNEARRSSGLRGKR
jgi:hypothetical protein